MESTDAPRRPKCTRCRHHGIIVPQKGHTKTCPFLKCHCCKCYLITQRTRIAALQRNLKKAQNEPRAKEERDAARGVRPAAEGASGAGDPDGGVRRSDAAGLVGPRPTHAAPTSTSATAWAPQHLHRPAEGPDPAPGLDSREVPVSADEGPRNAPPLTFGDIRAVLNVFPDGPFFCDLGRTAALPVFHFPFRMSAHYAPCSDVLPWLPHTRAGPYNPARLQPPAVHHPPPSEPGPPADGRRVFSTLHPPVLPDSFSEELMSKPHPPHPPHPHPPHPHPHPPHPPHPHPPHPHPPVHTEQD